MEQKPSLREAQTSHPRTFEENVYAYPVISRRSGGVSIGINLNLDKKCNFDCPYCQVDRTKPGLTQQIDLNRIRAETQGLLNSIDENGVCRLEKFSGLDETTKTLRDIALSGDGEPTMVPEFEQVCRLLSEIQASRSSLDFRLVLITNATLLDRKTW